MRAAPQKFDREHLGKAKLINNGYRRVGAVRCFDERYASATRMGKRYVSIEKGVAYFDIDHQELVRARPQSACQRAVEKSAALSFGRNKISVRTCWRVKVG